jgi:2-desacetyl-2-hydroxyethyl bacteriochlorophyllide A dehydrogenase
MRQAIMTAPGTIEFREAPEPTAGPGQVLLRVKRIGICGSDVHVYHGRHPFTSYPVVQGHEFSAMVEAVGEGVAGIPVGAMATARPQIVCGECRPCRRGDYHICDKLKVEGFQAPGVAQDLFAAEAERVVLLPHRFTHEQGALVEPLAVAVHATGRADVVERNVVVLGAGPIGNLVGQMCRSRGAEVLITDLSDFRLQRARECGLGAASNAASESIPEAARRAFGDGGFDVAFECSGAPASVSSAIAAISKGGAIVVVAVFQESPPLDLAVIGDRELRLVGTLMYRHGDYEEAVRRIGANEIVTEPLDSKHFPFAEYAAAYRYIEQQGAQCLKVFIDL